MAILPVGSSFVAPSAQGQEYGIEDAQASLLELAVVEGDGCMPPVCGRLCPFFFVMVEKNPDGRVRRRDFRRGRGATDRFQFLRAQLFQILGNLGGCERSGGCRQRRFGQICKAAVYQKIGSLARFPGGRGRRA
ncbi:MAG: hypothetical protein JKY97_00860 [Citromicrobium sp.]|nr:hypothetical protein [Citromicrobium sp.]